MNRPRWCYSTIHSLRAHISTSSPHRWSCHTWTDQEVTLSNYPLTFNTHADVVSSWMIMSHMNKSRWICSYSLPSIPPINIFPLSMTISHVNKSRSGSVLLLPHFQHVHRLPLFVADHITYEQVYQALFKHYLTSVRHLDLMNYFAQNLSESQFTLLTFVFIHGTRSSEYHTEQSDDK